MIDMWQARLVEDQEPRMQVMEDLSSEKLKLHLIQFMVFEYGCPCFSARSEASLLYVTVAAVPIPPAAERTSGVNNPCSTSRILDS